jgi:hypothetical protein
VKLSEVVSLTDIAKSTFQNTSITELVIPDCVVEICDSCFEGCGHLTTIVFTDHSQLQSVGARAFAGTSLVNFACPPRVIALGSEAFCTEMSSFASISLSAPLLTISAGLFAFALLTKCTIPARVTTISERAFDHCLHLSSVEFVEGSCLKTIEAFAFRDSGIKQFEAPLPVEVIEDSAFEGCQQLETFHLLGPRLCSLGRRTFRGCSALEDFSCESCHLTELADEVFASSGVTRVHFGPPDEASTPGQSARVVVSPEVKLMRFASGMASIGRESFARCHRLTMVQILGTSPLRSIGKGGFLDCVELEEVVLGGTNGISIGASGFQGCTKLTRFDTLRVCGLGESSFESTGLTDVILTQPLTEIPDRAFCGCHQLSKFMFHETVATRLGKFSLSETLITMLLVPSTLKEICEGACSGCHELRGIPPRGCTNLEVIGANAFKGTKFGRFDLSDESKLESIGAGAFEDTTLMSFSIPGSLKHLDETAFNKSRWPEAEPEVAAPQKFTLRILTGCQSPLPFQEAIEAMKALGHFDIVYGVERISLAKFYECVRLLRGGEIVAVEDFHLDFGDNAVIVGDPLSDGFGNSRRAFHIKDLFSGTTGVHPPGLESPSVAGSPTPNSRLFG